MLVAAFADFAESASSTGAVLSWYQSDRGGEVSGALKLRETADLRSRQACRDRTDAGNGQQPGGILVFTQLCGQITLDLIDLLVNVTREPVRACTWLHDVGERLEIAEKRKQLCAR